MIDLPLRYKLDFLAGGGVVARGTVHDGARLGLGGAYFRWNVGGISRDDEFVRYQVRKHEAVQAMGDTSVEGDGAEAGGGVEKVELGDGQVGGNDQSELSEE